MRALGRALPGHRASRRGPDFGPDIRTTATAEGDAVVPEDTANIVSGTESLAAALDLISTLRLVATDGCREIRRRAIDGGKARLVPTKEERARRIEPARRQESIHTILGEFFMEIYAAIVLEEKAR